MTVIIAGIPRSGSSLVAKIFVAHGLWVGRFNKKDQVKTPTPYDSFENVDIDAWCKNRSGRLQSLVNHILPDGKRLVYKCSPSKAAAVHANLDGSVLVRCKRKFKSIMKSSPDGTLEHRKTQAEQLDGMDGPVIDVDAVMVRDFTTLKNAFDYCSIAFDGRIAESCIDDRLWHHL